MLNRIAILEAGRLVGLRRLDKVPNENVPAGLRSRTSIQQSVLRINYKLGFVPSNPNTPKE